MAIERRWIPLASILLVAIGASCASMSAGSGDETHFVACHVDGDCRGDAAGFRCEAGKCRPAAGSGGASGSSGAAGASGVTNGGRSSGGAATDSGETPFCAAITRPTQQPDPATLRRLAGGAAAYCVLDPASYDQTCTQDADCELVGFGDSCSAPCGPYCPTEGINRRDLARWRADFAKTPLAACRSFVCFCPSIGDPVCDHGVCRNGARIRGSTDAAVDATSIDAH